MAGARHTEVCEGDVVFADQVSLAGFEGDATHGHLLAEAGHQEFDAVLGEHGWIVGHAWPEQRSGGRAIPAAVGDGVLDHVGVVGLEVVVGAGGVEAFAAGCVKRGDDSAVDVVPGAVSVAGFGDGYVPFERERTPVPAVAAGALAGVHRVDAFEVFRCGEEIEGEIAVDDAVFAEVVWDGHGDRNSDGRVFTRRVGHRQYRVGARPP